jgi:hypothetical protein
VRGCQSDNSTTDNRDFHSESPAEDGLNLEDRTIAVRRRGLQMETGACMRLPFAIKL